MGLYVFPRASPGPSRGEGRKRWIGGIWRNRADGVRLVFATFLDNTHQYATHARRTGLTAKDILRSCEVLGLGSAGELMEELSAHLPLDPSGQSLPLAN